ncbi:MAG: hypothetical protein M1816_007806 [Peltula sp. TS41687]|nr:MAG: hypothetical protein M1816_007806 [Peltula sp. TS41687]
MSPPPQVLKILETCGFKMGSVDADVKTLKTGRALEIRVKQSQFAEMAIKPSRVAWLQYRDNLEAEAIAENLNGRVVQGRKLECRLQRPSRTMFGQINNTISSIQVRNLDPETTSGQLLSEVRVCHSRSNPKVVMGELSYQAPDAESARVVQDVLRKSGDLEKFELYNSNGTKVKACATFLDPTAARRAVNDLSGKMVSPLVKSKLFLSHLVSVKFKILREMYETVQVDLDDIRSQTHAIRYIGMKIYAPGGPEQPFTFLRVYGDDVKLVAKAKNEYGAFVYRDARRRRLSMYGSEEAKQRTQDVLLNRVDDLLKQRHEILLNIKTLHSALGGGLAHITETLGDGVANLKITPNRRAIVVLGDNATVQSAHRDTRKASSEAHRLDKTAERSRGNLCHLLDRAL